MQDDKLTAALTAGQPHDPIAIATQADLAFVLDLQRKHSNALGFLPRAAIDWYLLNDRVRLATENGEPAGYVLGRPAYRWAPLMRPITQAAVAMDAQRRHIGLSLVARVCEEAAAAGQIGVQSMCAEGLDANHFWLAAGFKLIGRLTPANTRGREMLCWRKFFVNRLPLWAAHMPPLAGWKAASAALPRR